MSQLTAAPSPTPPAEDHLEAEADRLLWEDGRPRDLEYSFYRETTLNRSDYRRREDAEAPPPATLEAAQAQEVLGPLLEALLSEAALCERHRRVLSLARHGLSLAQTATAMGIKPQTARRWRQQALAQLHAYCTRRLNNDAVRNLEAAYREQLQVWPVAVERHCAPGREACRKDGLCKYRWYLQGEANAAW